MPGYRVIIHIDELAKADLTLSNARNLLTEFGDQNVEIELVVNHDAIFMVQKKLNPRTGVILELMKRGVRCAACRHSMNSFGIPDQDLIEGVTPVPSAMGEIVKKQRARFGYIKP